VKKILENLRGFLIVITGLTVLVIVTAIVLTSYRGGKLYYAEFKSFKGALSRASGGDWVVATPEPYVDEVYIDGQEPDQLALNLPTKGLKALAKEIQEELKTRVDK
jgi:hypothetical protein